MKKIITPYFPIGLKYSTPLLFGLAIYLLFESHPIWAVICILLGVIIITTQYVTEIDLKNKRFRDYLLFLFIPFSEESRKFDRIEKIIITKGNYVQTINTLVQSRQRDWSDYTATLIFNHTRTLELLTKNDKHELLLKIKEFAQIFNTVVEDHTTSRHYIIDLGRVV
jgi:hypothetical protein